MDNRGSTGRTIRIFTMPDGGTRAEDMELDGGHSEDGAAMLMHSVASEAVMMRFDPGYQQDWHCSPVPTLCVVVSGEALFTTSDGDVGRYGPGAVVRTEDITGAGHTTGAGADGAVLLVVRLSEGDA